MPNYVFTYRIQEGDSGSPEGMAKWMAWFEQMGARWSTRASRCSRGSTLGNCGSGERARRVLADHRQRPRVRGHHGQGLPGARAAVESRSEGSRRCSAGSAKWLRGATFARRLDPSVHHRDNRSQKACMHRRPAPVARSCGNDRACTSGSTLACIVRGRRNNPEAQRDSRSRGTAFGAADSVTGRHSNAVDLRSRTPERGEVMGTLGARRKRRSMAGPSRPRRVPRTPGLSVDQPERRGTPCPPRLPPTARRSQRKSAVIDDITKRLADRRRVGAHRVPRAHRHRPRQPPRRAAARRRPTTRSTRTPSPAGPRPTPASPRWPSCSKGRSRSRSSAPRATRWPRPRRCATSPRRNPNLVVKGGMLGPRLLTVGDVEALADVPPRDVLLARLAGGFQAPLVKAAGLFQAFTRNFAYGLKALDRHQRADGGRTAEPKRRPPRPSAAEAAAEAEPPRARPKPARSRQRRRSRDSRPSETSRAEQSDRTGEAN